MPPLGAEVTLRLPDGMERELTNVATERRAEGALVTFWPPRELWVVYQRGGLGTV